ncbi:right-handed parallel beta-helix repeat-containing protein, partial [Trichloromonas sp.]|uniref:right-handed parallel beta-helix repeat-containing protein n=1 Tax=Trichloromonas sp. TaxID=3069249 RepID=UPI003D818ED1
MINRIFKSKAKIAVLFALTIVLLSSTCWAATYYIDPTAGEGGVGSQADPFNSWHDVTWAAGNSYLQKRGTTFRDGFTVTASGTSGAHITLGAYGSGPRPIIFSTNDQHTIYVYQRSYIDIKDLHIKNTYNSTGKTQGNGISTGWHDSKSSHITIDNCEVGPTNATGILLYGVHNAIIRNSLLHDAGTGINPAYKSSDDNIHLENCHDYLIEYNESYYSAVGSEIDTSDSGSGYSTGVVRYNIVHNSGPGAALIKLSGHHPNSRADIYYNVVYDGGECIGFQEQLSGTVSNNTIYDCTTRGIAVATQNQEPNGDVVIKNNVIANIGPSGLSWPAAAIGFSDNLSPVEMDNNLYYGLNGDSLAARVNGKNYATVASIAAGTAFEDNGIEADPKFTNTATKDFSLQASSPAIDRGADVSSAVSSEDIAGTPNQQGGL